MQENQNTPINSLPYPGRGTLDRLIYKLPLFLWRLGYGPLLSHPIRGGSRMLVLTVRGRKSGLPRHTMVSHIEVEGQDYILSGWGPRSQWVRNILEDPLVTVQIYRRSYSALIRQVTDREEFSLITEHLFQTGGDSHFKPWLASLEVDFSPQDMIAKRDRVYMFGFDPVDQAGPAPLRADLAWVHIPVLAVIGVGIWLLIS